MRATNTHGWAGGLLCALAACSGGATIPSNDHGVEHVVLISIDTLRADRLGSYGFRIDGQSPSPNLDALAAEGVVAERHFSAAPTTLSSHTSLFTGTWPHTHGVMRNGFRVHPDNVLLPEVLAPRGWTTAGFIGAAPLMEAVDFNQGFHHYDFRYSESSDGSPSGHQRRAEDVTDATLGWLDERYEGSVDEPLFLFVHYFDVHAPYDAPAPFGQRFRTEGWDDLRPSPNSPDVVHRMRRRLALEGMDGGPGDVAFERGYAAALEREHADEQGLIAALDAAYCAEIAYTDHHVGRLLDGLRERGVLESALVVVTSDHGETFAEHASPFSHGETVFDTEIHTPLLLSFPGQRYAGRRLSGLASNVDVMPSVLDVLDLEPPARSEGVSLLPALQGELDEARQPIFAEATKPFRDPRFGAGEAWPNRSKFRCVRSERFKYVLRGPDGLSHLYDVEADPLEQHDLLAATPPVATDVLLDLQSRLEAWGADASPLPSAQVTSNEQLEALRALGYLGGD